MLELRINFVLSIITILMVFHHCISMKPMIVAPQSNPILAPKKGMRGPKKETFPNPYWYGLFAKKNMSILVNFGHCGPIYVLQKQYRGLQPCLSSQIAVSGVQQCTRTYALGWPPALLYLGQKEDEKNDEYLNLLIFLTCPPSHGTHCWNSIPQSWWIHADWRQLHRLQIHYFEDRIEPL